MYIIGNIEREKIYQFKDSLFQAIAKSGTTFETISRPIYVNTCEKYGIKGWSLDEIKAYNRGWTMLKKDCLRVCNERDSQKLDNVSIDCSDETPVSEDSLMKLAPDYFRDRAEILAEFAKFVREYHYVPTPSVYKRWSLHGIPRTLYRNIQELDDDYRVYYKQEAKNNIFDKKSWTDDYKKQFWEEVNKHDKFIFTSIGSFCEVDMDFLGSLEAYAKKNNAMIIGLPLFKRYNKASYDFCIPAEVAKRVWIAFSDIRLNNNLMVQVIKANCTTKSTLIGLNQIVSKYDSSIIVAGINQQLKYIPVLKDKTPNLIASTGCCTNYEPVKKDDIYIPTKTEKLAQERLSIKGALAVDLYDNDIFTVRNIEADEKTGRFMDLGILYSSQDAPRNIFYSTFVIGDLHAPLHNEVLLEANIKAIQNLRCNQVVLHDSVNMSYISHHNADQAITRAQLVEDGRADILVEIKAFADILQRLSMIDTVEKILIPYSNHPAHFEKFIQDIGRMSKDDINLRTSLQTALAMLDNKNTLQFLVEEIVGVKLPKVEWINEDEGREVYGVQVGLHGSEKVNGGRMTSTSTNNAFKKTVLAHRHSASIDGDTITVGIVCEKDQGYNHGLSSWTESSAVIYPDGKVQLLTFVNVKGDYKLWL